MILKIDKSFTKDLLKLKNKKLAVEIKKIMNEIELSDNILGIPNIRKMEGFRTYYRIRIGDYRLGIELENEKTIILLRFKHRKDIYKVFP